MKPLLAAAFAALSLAALPAQAASGNACAEPYVLLTIARNFAGNAPVYPGLDATIDRIADPRLKRFEPRTQDISSVERHYCQAVVSLSDGKRRNLWYLVEKNMAFAGLGTHVEFCIGGLDPWYVYGADCRSLR